MLDILARVETGESQLKRMHTMWCIRSAWQTMPTRWATPAGSSSGAARERGTSSPPAHEEPAF